MADGRGKALWSHTSAVLCLLANVNRNPKKQRQAYKPSDFDPYHRKAPVSRMPKVKLRSLKGSLFPNQKAKVN